MASLGPSKEFEEAETEQSTHRFVSEYKLFVTKSLREQTLLNRCLVEEVGLGLAGAGL